LKDLVDFDLARRGHIPSRHADAAGLEKLQVAPIVLSQEEVGQHLSATGRIVKPPQVDLYISQRTGFGQTPHGLNVAGEQEALGRGLDPGRDLTNRLVHRPEKHFDPSSTTAM
jgi:hypothetical protein